MRESLWITRLEAAELCGVQVRTFDDNVKPLIDAASVRGEKAKLRYYAPGVVVALIAYQGKKPAKGETVSPAMETVRQHKAELAAMDVQERRGELVNVEAMRRGMMAGIVALRGGGDLITRRHGNDAGELFNEVVAEFEAAAVAALKNV